MFTRKYLNCHKMSALTALRERRSDEDILALIDNGADVNEQECSLTPLQLALEMKYSDGVILALLKKGADVKCFDAQVPFEKAFDDAVHAVLSHSVEEREHFRKFEIRPLQFALKMKNSNYVIHALIDRAADVKTGDFDGNPLHLALGNRYDVGVIMDLIDKGAEVNGKDFGGSPLQVALKHQCSVDVVSALIDRGADVNAEAYCANELVEEPLVVALLNNCCDSIIFTLLNKGASVEGHNFCKKPLSVALTNKYSDGVVLALIDKDTDPIDEKFGNQLLCLALKHKYGVNIICELMDRGANINTLKNDRNPLCVAFKKKCSDDVIFALLHKEPSVTDRNYHAKLLMIALEMKSSQNIALALVNKAPATTLKRIGKQLLHMAVELNLSGNFILALIDKVHGLTAKDLRKLAPYFAQRINQSIDDNIAISYKGTNPNVQYRSSLLLTLSLAIAVANKFNGNFMTVLLNGGARATAVDNKGNTFIHKAIEFDNTTDVLKLFFKAGVRVSQDNLEGQTALERALEPTHRHKVDVIELLLKRAVLEDHEKLAAEICPEIASFYTRCVDDMMRLKDFHVSDWSDHITLYDIVVCPTLRCHISADDVMDYISQSPSLYCSEVLEVIAESKAFRRRLSSGSVVLNEYIFSHIFDFLGDVDRINVLLAYRPDLQPQLEKKTTVFSSV